jgi:phosphatidylethanolamine/phosphatidyl-N-methylethanolamine N-methyltransferase
MDGQDLIFEDKTFDYVILHLILAVIPDPEKCLLEVERVLKKQR